MHNRDLNYDNYPGYIFPKNKICFLTKVTSQNYSCLIIFVAVKSLGLAKLSPIKVYEYWTQLFTFKTDSFQSNQSLYSKYKLMWENGFANVTRKFQRSNFFPCKYFHISCKYLFRYDDWATKYLRNLQIVIDAKIPVKYNVQVSQGNLVPPPQKKKKQQQQSNGKPFIKESNLLYQIEYNMQSVVPLRIALSFSSLTGPPKTQF